jgi:hypothetical protein
MVNRENQDNITSSGDADARMEMESILNADENPLECLSSSRLARRIIDAAYMATAKHMLFEAQAMPSHVEAENSAQ